MNNRGFSTSVRIGSENQKLYSHKHNRLKLHLQDQQMMGSLSSLLQVLNFKSSNKKSTIRRVYGYISISYLQQRKMQQLRVVNLLQESQVLKVVLLLKS